MPGRGGPPAPGGMPAAGGGIPGRTGGGLIIGGACMLGRGIIMPGAGPPTPRAGPARPCKKGMAVVWCSGRLQHSGGDNKGAYYYYYYYYYMVYINKGAEQHAHTAFAWWRRSHDNVIMQQPSTDSARQAGALF